MLETTLVVLEFATKAARMDQGLRGSVLGRFGDVGIFIDQQTTFLNYLHPVVMWATFLLIVGLVVDLSLFLCPPKSILAVADPQAVFKRVMALRRQSIAVWLVYFYYFPMLVAFEILLLMLFAPMLSMLGWRGFVLFVEPFSEFAVFVAVMSELVLLASFFAKERRGPLGFALSAMLLITGIGVTNIIVWLAKLLAALAGLGKLYGLLFVLVLTALPVYFLYRYNNKRLREFPQHLRD